MEGKNICRMSKDHTIPLTLELLDRLGWVPEQHLFIWSDGESLVLSPNNSLCRWCGEDDPDYLLPVDESREAYICDRCVKNALRAQARRDGAWDSDGPIR